MLRRSLRRIESRSLINAPQVWTFPSSLALLGESLLISLPPGTKIFQFPGLATLSSRSNDQVSLFGHSRVKAYSAAHRDLSQPYHVLHRLLTPRHPPYTLSNLNFFLNYLSSTNYHQRFDSLMMLRSRIVN